jgi:F0F1-type ATP synthase membrane subunit b/b'
MDELRSEIARLSAAAAEHVVTGQLTDEVHRDLIESFIQKVGASR